VPNGRKFLRKILLGAIFLAKRPADHAPVLVQIDSEFQHLSVRILGCVDKRTAPFPRRAKESLDFIGALTLLNRLHLRVAQRPDPVPIGRTACRRNDNGSQDKGGHE
jgi:hypothetical protein